MLAATGDDVMERIRAAGRDTADLSPEQVASKEIDYFADVMEGIVKKGELM